VTVKEVETLEDDVLETIVDCILIGLTGTHQSGHFIIKATRPLRTLTVTVIDVMNGNTIQKQRDWSQLMLAIHPQMMLKSDINKMKSKLNEVSTKDWVTTDFEVVK
jgi:hypothetical protein